MGKIPFFEVNTGAISRGYRSAPYPTVPIIKELKRLGFGVVITSDCHDRNYVDCHFNETAELLKIPQGTAATRQRKALKLLKLELGEEVSE